jgi:transposase
VLSHAIQAALASQQLEAPPVVAAAYGQVVAAAVAVIASLSQQLAGLEAALTSAFVAHRDAGIVRSQPGLGLVLAARVVAEFGDDPNRYASARALANRLVGILHGCLGHHQLYDEQLAWPTTTAAAA